MKTSDFNLPIHHNEYIHLKRFYTNESASPMLLIHGSIENGKIFYSQNGKGFAPFRAQYFDVFVLDLQGRGNSYPATNKYSKYGQHDAITIDIPLAIDKINNLKNHAPIIYVGHSWGGVLLASTLARFQYKAKAMIFFGTKRRITIRTAEYFKQILVNWHIIGRFLILIYGFLPAKKLKFGSDNEPKNHYRQINAWLGKKAKWIDPIDSFDYEEACKKSTLAPSLSLIGEKDTLLGNAIDAQLFVNELQTKQNTNIFLAKNNGFLHDYDHINMLTHKDATRDHFPKIVNWIFSL